MKSRKFNGSVWVEFMTIKDKVRVISAPRPTEYWVQIWFGNLCVRDFTYNDRATARGMYDKLREQFASQETK